METIMKPILAAVAIITAGYLTLNIVIPKAIYVAVESGMVEAPSNYSIYRAKLAAI